MKIYMLICGIVMALSLSYVTHVYFKYRTTNAEWNRTFVSPETFWDINTSQG